jgi:hypothetical protein
MGFNGHGLETLNFHAVAHMTVAFDNPETTLLYGVRQVQTGASR